MENPESSTQANTDGPSKSELIRQEIRAGNSKAADIRKALSARGVEVSDNLIHSVKQKLKVHEPIAPGVVRVRSAGTAIQHAPEGRGSKKAAIIQLYNQGMTKASEIKDALARQGVQTSDNNIYVVLAELRSSAKAPAKKAPKTPARPPLRKVVAQEEGPLHPDLVTLMQAAALQFGSEAVTQAAQHVSTRSREMIQQAFSRSA